MMSIPKDNGFTVQFSSAYNKNFVKIETEHGQLLILRLVKKNFIKRFGLRTFIS